MKTYYTLNDDGSITASADFPFSDDCFETGKEIVRGHDGKLYFADEAPIKPENFIQQELAAQIRAQRDFLLAATDYLVMPDYLLSEERRDAIIAYRQTLRDVPEQFGFPHDIEWPTVSG